MGDGDPGPWALVVGDELVAILLPRSREGRYHVCSFEPTAAFEAYRPLFEREVAALDAGRDTGNHDRYAREYDAAWREIWASGLRLRLTDGTEPESWIVHVEDETARVRFVDPRLGRA